MKTYSILIKGAGPIGTGDASQSADLLAGDLIKRLIESGHAIEHASLQNNETGTVLIIGQATPHPPAPEEKKRKAAPKAKASPPSTESGPESPDPAYEGSGSEEASPDLSAAEAPAETNP